MVESYKEIGYRDIEEEIKKKTFSATKFTAPVKPKKEMELTDNLVENADSNE